MWLRLVDIYVANFNISDQPFNHQYGLNGALDVSPNWIDYRLDDSVTEENDIASAKSLSEAETELESEAEPESESVSESGSESDSASESNHSQGQEALKERAPNTDPLPMCGPPYAPSSICLSGVSVVLNRLPPGLEPGKINILFISERSDIIRYAYYLILSFAQPNLLVG